MDSSLLSLRPCYGNYKGLRLMPDRPLPKFSYKDGIYDLTNAYYSEMIPRIYQREKPTEFNFEYDDSYYQEPEYQNEEVYEERYIPSPVPEIHSDSDDSDEWTET